MKSLKANNLILALYLIALTSCTTSYFKIHKEVKGKTEIKVTPDRVSATCYPNEEERYGLLIHVLDDQNTVLNMIHTLQTDKKTCEKTIAQLKKIFTTGKDITIAGMHNLDSPRKKGEYKYHFPKHGTFYDNERVLQFMFIWNENGQCLSAYRGQEKSCPRDEFPIKDGEK